MWFDMSHPSPHLLSTEDNPYNIGDILVCVDCDGSPLVVGKNYLLTGIESGFLTVMDDMGVKWPGWAWDRFRLITDFEHGHPMMTYAKALHDVKNEIKVGRFK